ncbi:hypothetical protein Q0812_10255 [Brevundimonas sp. 2R-24]|uniref:Uncharacterized protein n=1 Tax=Peiella sedimenti TaxID=3061083 RepID=A0ABT8SQT4_9CAUL|nr:hypothetical protein [Caulobacteraceae bacterium XZ-24]
MGFYQPHDPQRFFDRLGTAYVQRAIVRGEFKGDLLARANTWLAFRTRQLDALRTRYLAWGAAAIGAGATIIGAVMGG